MADARNPSVYSLCGVPIAVATLASATSMILEAARLGRPLEVHLCNTYTLSLVDGDPRLAAALQESNLNLPDGKPVALMGRKAGVMGPVRGPSLLRAVVAGGVEDRIRHYFYGGATGVAEQLAGVLQSTYARAVSVGHESPTFGEPTQDELAAVIDRVRAAQAQVLWLGFGTPRQDYLVPLLAEKLEIPVVPVGAAFDFLTGRVKEAPVLIHGSGLEWLYRFAQEPSRLWRRYLLGSPRFLLSALRHTRCGNTPG